MAGRRLRPVVGALSLAVAAAAGASPAAATDGSLYAFGVEALVAHAAPDGQCSATQTGASFGVTCPPAGISLTGTKWQIDLRTPVGGSAIEAFSWQAVRFHQTATSIAQQVLADGSLAWQVAESDIPRSPSQPKAYQVGLRAQTASLRLWQTEARQQPNRVWTFLYPTIYVRDLEAPAVRWISVPGGWITDDRAQVQWQATDNFGADGIAQQRISVAGRGLYAASPGDGAHATVVNLAAIPDGVQTVRLEADGDGTAAAPPQEAVLRVDRTPPVASVSLLGLPSGQVRATISVSDAVSGVGDWTLHARSADGPTVASSTGGVNMADIDLAAYATPGETIRFVLDATDNAGLTREVTSAPVTRAVGGSGGPTTAIVGADGPLGEPGRIESSGVPLPNFSRVQTPGVRSANARSYSRAGRLQVPLVVATYSRPLTLAGRFQQGNGRGLHRASVYLIDPRGFTRATTLTDRRGRFSFRVRPLVAGTWRAVALGRPLVVAPAVIRLRPLVRTEVGAALLHPGGSLTVTGQIVPRRAGRAKLVKLEWRDAGGWRPLALATADRGGRFALRYRFSASPGAFTIPLRVVVPKERGWHFLPLVARRFSVRVG